MDKIHDLEIVEWINDCPTHKCEINHIDKYGICLTVRFNNEPDEEPLILTKEMEVK